MSKNTIHKCLAESNPLKSSSQEGQNIRYIIGRQILKKYATKLMSTLRSKMLQKMSKEQFKILNDNSYYVEDSYDKQSIATQNKQIQNSNDRKEDRQFCFSCQVPLFSTESIYIQGKYISNRPQILKNCLMSYTFYSRVSIIVLFLNIEGSYQQNFIYLIFIIAHSYTIFCFLSKLQEKIMQFQILKKITQLLLLVNYAFCIAHLASLLWVYVGITETQSQQKSWITQFLKIDERSIEQNRFEIYIASLHYIIVTMVTVGYGDIYPTTSNERLFNILVMITSSLVFAYIVNSVGQILSEIHNSKKEIENKKSVIKAYMKKKNISIELQQQILQYLYYFWIKSKNSKCNEEQIIINELSDELKQTLLMEANKLIVQDYALFSQNFSEQFLQKVVQIIQEKNFCPFQQIFTDGDKDTAIYFVEEGLVEKYLDLQEPLSLNKKGVHVIQTLEKGMLFGVKEFFTGKKRQFNARSKDFCTLLCIERQDFIHLLKDYNKDFERFCDIRDTMILNAEQSEVKLECFGCKQLNHLIENCPFVHYIPDKQKVILKSGYNYVESNRYPNKRQKSKMTKNNTFHNVMKIQIEQNKFFVQKNEIVEQYIMDNIQFLDDSEQEDDDNNNNNNLNEQAEKYITSIREIQKLEDKNNIFVNNSPCQRDENIMSQSIDKHESYERLKSGQSLIKEPPQNFTQSLVKRQFSQLFYENQDELREKNRKSTFVNVSQANLVGLSPGIHKSKSRSNQNIEIETVNDGQSFIQSSSPHKISVPSISELVPSQNALQIEQGLKERNNTYFSKKQQTGQYQSTANFTGNNSIGFPKKVPEYMKRNSLETYKNSLFNQNKQYFQRNLKNRNFSKVFLLQVEQQIQKLQEQFIQSQMQNKIIYHQENSLLYFDLVKSFTHYKPQFNVTEVLKRYRSLQLKNLSKISFKNNKFNNLFYIQIDVLNFQPSIQPVDESKVIESFMNLKKRRQSKGANQSQGKQLLKKYNIQQSELEDSQLTYHKDSQQKKPGFSEFIFKIQSASFLDTLTNKNKYLSPLTCKKVDGKDDIQKQESIILNNISNNEKEEFSVDTPKSSVHSLKYLPQFKNFEIQKKSQFHDGSNMYNNIYSDINKSETESIKEINISSIRY